MTSSSPSSKWHGLYSVEQANWDDARRIFSFTVVLVIVLMITTLYVGFYIYAHLGRFSIPVSLILFLPGLIASIGFVFTIRSAIVFFNSIHISPDGSNTARLIFKRLFGVPPTSPPFNTIVRYPFVLLNIATVDNGKFVLENEVVNWLGGPALLIIFDGTGVYIERGNQFSRTLGPGIAFLERFERVRDIVDLRPQTIRSDQQDWPPPISGRTKDGIKIKFNIEIKFHILRPKIQEAQIEGEQDGKTHKISSMEVDAHKLLNTPKSVYSGDLDAIKKAVERTSVRYRDSEYLEAKWRDGVWGAVSGRLATYITQHYFDELLVVDDAGHNDSYAHFVGERIKRSLTNTGGKNNEPGKAGQLLSHQSRELIRRELDSSLQADLGVTLTDLRILDFDIHQEIYAQYFNVLEAGAKSRIKRAEGASTALQIHTREEVRARAQQDLIKEIADGVIGIDPQNFTDSVLLLLSGILDQSLKSTAIPSILARDNLMTLEQLRDFLDKV